MALINLNPLHPAEGTRAVIHLTKLPRQNRKKPWSNLIKLQPDGIIGELLLFGVRVAALNRL
jgi:hypothetical protein